MPILIADTLTSTTQFRDFAIPGTYNSQYVLVLTANALVDMRYLHGLFGQQDESATITIAPGATPMVAGHPVDYLGGVRLKINPASTVNPVSFVAGFFAPGEASVNPTFGSQQVPFSGGGAGGATETVVLLDTPDQSGNGYLAFTLNNGFTNIRRILPAFTLGVLSTWEGATRVPNNFSAGGTIVLSGVTNAVAGSVRLRVGTAIVGNGVSENTGYTQEAYVNTAVPGTALRRFDVSFPLSTALVQGSTVNVQVTRDGGNAADTLAADYVLWQTTLTYT